MQRLAVETKDAVSINIAIFEGRLQPNNVAFDRFDLLLLSILYNRCEDVQLLEIYFELFVFKVVLSVNDHFRNS
jgi:hypothetical protein